MPYIVKVGDVISGGERYPIGTVLPDGIGDEAMVSAGAVELVEDPGASDIPEVPAEDDGPSPSTDEETAPEEDAEAAPAPSEPDIDAMDFAALRDAAKAAGINSFGKSADTLRDELREVT